MVHTAHRDGDVALDLSLCEQEPIHIPGAVQPHGVLLALDTQLSVVQLSEDYAAHLGLPPAQLLDQPLAAALGDEGAARVRERLRSSGTRDPSPLPITTPSGRGFDGILHESGGLILLELEPTQQAHPLTFSEYYRHTRQVGARLQRSDGSVAQLCDLAAAELWRLTGFDRVMVYRFDRHWNGEVIAESRAAGVPSFLGHHYPASDIPAQARRLYTLNWLRLIVDVDYVPARLIPALNPVSGAPLDLSHAVLRSVSPYHTAYLRGMGLAASMSVSLMRGDALWGLIACHHHRPKFVPYDVRMACESLGQTLSFRIDELERTEHIEQRAAAQGALGQLIVQMGGAADWTEALLARPEALCRLVDASGAALCYDGAVRTAGAVPSQALITSLRAWLPERMRGAAFQTDALPQRFPAAQGEQACGLLAVELGQRPGDLLLWFRPAYEEGAERARRLHQAEGATPPRLSPAGSFAQWRQDMLGFSRPWAPWHLDVAQDLRHAISGAVMERAQKTIELNRELARVGDELRAASRAEDEFLTRMNHELRTPLNAVIGYAELLEEELQDRALLDMAAPAKRIQTAATHLLSLISDILDLSKISAGKMELHLGEVRVGDLVRDAADTVDPLLTRASNRLECRVAEPDLQLRTDGTKARQCLLNLLSNAAKFTAAGWITLSVEREADAAGEWVTFRVTDTGIGMTPEQQEQLQPLVQLGSVPHRTHEGTGLGLVITRHLCALLGGRLKVRSEAGVGSEFTLQLPLTPPSA